MLMAFIALCDTILSYFYIDIPALSYIGGCSFLTLAFIYLASYAFRFCEYHRILTHKEAEHIKQHMLKAYNVDDFGEAPAYTIGYLVMMMLKLNLFCC